jgi:putative oxidoreductase
MKNKLVELYALFLRALDFFSPVANLAIRLYVANVFWLSGQTKIASWDSTLALFENEYAVPLLPPEIAAYMGTGVELGMPIFLALGLGTRFAAIVLFVFNIIAVISYPDLGEVGLKDHTHWGLLLLVPVFYGAGKLSIDHWLFKYFSAPTRRP